MTSNNNVMELYDRQNRTYGTEATKTLTTSNVVVFGLEGGVSTELCKNLILSGVQNIILIDDDTINRYDMETGYYYNECDIGLSRAQVLSKKLSELNPYCVINCCSIEKVDFQEKTVICSNMNYKMANKVNKICRENNSKFVWIKTSGVSGFVFVDALNMIVFDSNGENIEPVQIDNICCNGIVTCATNNVHDFQSGDCIKFTNMEGNNIDFLNNEWIIKVINKNSFKLENFPDVSDNFNLLNGTVVHIKKPLTVNHNSLENQMSNRTIEGYNQNYDNSIISFLTKDIPVPVDSWGEEMELFVSEYEDTRLQKIIRSSNFELMPVVSVVASLGAMEVIKLITNKFTPINQWLVYSDSDFVPNSKPEDIGCYGISNLFGEKVKSTLEDSNWLMVGCGAIGCEMLKNLAKLNLTTNGGSIYVTDPDHIEKSNLSRQFLFRNSHIGCSKSLTATESIKMMNPKMNIIPMEQKMSPENQLLVDNMLPKLTGVINALDNIEARRYMDEQCFRYGKPLFESGTQGMKGNTQPVIPFVTETYSNSSDPPQEKSFPVCTIKNFPNQPLHTVHWAMDYFEQYRRGPENVSKYMKEGVEFFDTLSGYDKSVAKEDVFKYCVKYNPKSWCDCAVWASDIFLELYRDQIVQLLHSFPKDSITSDGQLFWSKGKRCPDVLYYDLSDDDVVNFLEATTHLLTRTLNLDDNFTKDEMLEFLITYKPYEFTVDESKKIASNDEELKNEVKVENNFDIPKDIEDRKMVPQEFEKDDNTNWHIAFVTAASNLRSKNYGIPKLTFDECKGIAGKIVPAVATTTSIVAGLITMEIIKYINMMVNEDIHDTDNLKLYKSWFVSLANNILVPTEPISAPKLKVGNVEINSWTKFELYDDMELIQFINMYENKFNTSISMVLYGTSIMFANFMSSSDIDKMLSRIFIDKYETNIFDKNVEIVIVSEDETIELPVIQLKLK